jgi:uncharacterized UBP type Zn finger protein
MDAHCNTGVISDHLDLIAKNGRPYRYQDVATSTATRLTEAPPSLPIHFKRFDEQGNKIDASITMPKRYMLELQNGTKVPYQLNSFLVHAGNSKDRGHYFSFRRNEDGQWYMMNDGQVEKIDENKLALYLKQVYFAQYSRP